MSYAIVGFGKIGQALAHAFARKNIDVTVASRRPPEALAPRARTIGPSVVAKSLREAFEADIVMLAVPGTLLPKFAWTRATSLRERPDLLASALAPLRRGRDRWRRL